MTDWFYTCPDWVLLAVPAIILAALSYLLPPLVHRLPRLAPSMADGDFAMRLQPTLFTLTALVLVFTLVGVEANLRKVEGVVATEASHINRLDRLVTRYGDPSAREVRVCLRTYTSSLVDDEWPSMSRGVRHEGTHRAFIELGRSILVIEPSSGGQGSIYAEILKSFDAVAETRDLRLSALPMVLPAIYWKVVLVAVAMLLFVSSAIERTPFRAAALAAQMFVIGAFIGFVFVVDQPFKGQSAVSPRAIVETIALIDARL